MLKFLDISPVHWLPRKWSRWIISVMKMLTGVFKGMRNLNMGNPDIKLKFGQIWSSIWKKTAIYWKSDFPSFPHPLLRPPTAAIFESVAFLWGGCGIDQWSPCEWNVHMQHSNTCKYAQAGIGSYFSISSLCCYWNSAWTKWYYIMLR